MTRLAVLLDDETRRRLLDWAKDERAARVRVLVQHARLVPDGDRVGRPAYCEYATDRQKVVFDTEQAAYTCCAALQALSTLPECRAYRHDDHWHLTSWVEE